MQTTQHTQTGANMNSSASGGSQHTVKGAHPPRSHRSYVQVSCAAEPDKETQPPEEELAGEMLTWQASKAECTRQPARQILCVCREVVRGHVQEAGTWPGDSHRDGCCVHHHRGELVNAALDISAADASNVATPVVRRSHTWP